MYIRQFPAPMAIYPLRLVLAQGFHLLISMGIVLVMAGTLRGISNPLALVSLVPSLALLFMLGWSLAVCTGLASLHFPDAKHMIELVFQGIFYLTPVMLTDDILNTIGMFEYYQLNPFGWYLRLLRQPILEGTFPSPSLFAATTVFAVGALCLASLALRRLERRIIFHL
jgi:ABC-type polysaccharide/polyol phosphate export permease